MNRWKIAIILLIAASGVILVAASQYGWEPWSTYRSLIRSVRPSPPFEIRPQDERYAMLSGLAAFTTMYLSGILVLFAIPARVRRMELAFHAPTRGLIRLVALGLLAGLLMAVVGLSSALTWSTFPMMIFLGSVLFLSAYSGFISLAYSLGRQLLVRAEWGQLSPLFALFVGLLILYGLSQLPLVGDIVKIISITLGMGAIIATRFGSGKAWNLNPLTEEQSIEA